MKYPVVQVVSAKPGTVSAREFATLLARRRGKRGTWDEIRDSLGDERTQGRLKIHAYLTGASTVHGFDDRSVPGVAGGYPFLTVILVPDDTVTADMLSARLAEVPPEWTPLVLVACGAPEKKADAAAQRFLPVEDAAKRFLPVLDKQFQDADISFVDVVRERRPDFWWWDQNYPEAPRWADILTTGFGRPSRDLEKVFDEVASVDVELRQRRRGAGAVIVEPTPTPQNADVVPRLVILDVAEKWAFVGGDGLSKSARDDAEQRRSAYTMALQLLKAQGAPELRLVLPKGKRVTDLHPDLLGQLGPDPLLLPMTMWRPLLWQIRRLPPEMLLALSENPALAGTGGDDDAQLIAYRGMREVLRHQADLYRARGGGDTVAQLEALVDQARTDMVRIADFGFESLIRDVRGGAYPGMDGTPRSKGSRGGEPWMRHFPVSKHLVTAWSTMGEAGWKEREQQKNRTDNWVESRQQPQIWNRELFDARIEVNANERAKKVLSKAIASYCKQQIDATGTLCDIYFSLALHGEARQLVRRQRRSLETTQRENSQPESQHAGNAKGSALPAAIRRASGIAADRASSIVTEDRLRDAVPRFGWPVVNNVPHVLNISVQFKSIWLVVKWLGKVGAGLTAAVVIAGQLWPGLRVAVGNGTNDAAGSQGNNPSGQPVSLMDKLQGWLDQILGWLPEGVRPVDDSIRVEYVLVSVVLVALASLFWHGRLNLRFQQSEKLDKLRDDTHRAIEDAAAKQLAQARLAFLAAIDDDLDAFRAQMLTEIQRQDRAHLDTIAPRLRRIEKEIERLEPLVRTATKTVSAGRANAMRLSRGKLMLGGSA